MGQGSSKQQSFKFLIELQAKEKEKALKDPKLYSQAQTIKTEIVSTKQESVNYSIAAAMKAIAGHNNANGKMYLSIPKDGDLCLWTATAFLVGLLPWGQRFSLDNIQTGSHHEDEIKKQTDFWGSFTPNSFYETEFKQHINEAMIRQFLGGEVKLREDALAAAAIEKKRREDAFAAAAAEERKRREDAEEAQARPRREAAAEAKRIRDVEALEARRKKEAEDHILRLNRSLHALFAVGEYGPKQITTREVRGYLDQGAQIDYQGEKGFTALMLAADNNNEQIVEYLLEQGANPSIKNASNELASKLVSKGSPIYFTLKNWELQFAAKTNDLFAARLAYRTGADINFQGPDGYTALMMAVRDKHIEIVRFLLSQNANLSLAADDDNTVHALPTSDEIRVLLNPAVAYSALASNIEESNAAAPSSESASVVSSAESGSAGGPHSFWGRFNIPPVSAASAPLATAEIPSTRTGVAP